ncbi:MAG TPA: TMEM175 family protein [Candidatus Krumholzibacteria bacterium]|nr:TMEM175 family protein [Candidatus Krumholzibacteria bacterium]HRX50107.1 TMEM175 family protein [Candidatus Krumholzibacteria bacterium]
MFHREDGTHAPLAKDPPMPWTDARLAELPDDRGFRLRGLEMTRLEGFVDAAFAFATTMLVISLSGIPSSVGELTAALKDVPAFLAGFVSIASFWQGHRRWSRRYGLEDGPTIQLSLALVFVMLVFVYPLKMVFSALFAWVSNGWLPTSFSLRTGQELAQLFVVYGVGFCAMTGIVALLYGRALKAREALRLNDLEQLMTRQAVTAHVIMAGTGLASALCAWLLPVRWGMWSGFFYATLPVTMPLTAILYERRAERLRAAS